MESTVQIRKKVRKHIRETINNSRVQTKGYRVEYQCKPHKGDWDGHFYTFEELVRELIEMEVADWDIWVTTYDLDSRDEPNGEMCMLYQYFNLKQILSQGE